MAARSDTHDADQDDWISDSEESSDYEYSGFGLDTDICYIGKSTFNGLNYSPNYLPSWGLDEAF